MFAYLVVLHKLKHTHTLEKLRFIVCANNQNFQQKFFCTFSLLKHTVLVRILGTKSNIRTIAYILKHHINIQMDENFHAIILESKNRTKPDKSAHYENVQRA